MKRSEFLKRLGLGLGAAVAAPKLLGEEKAQEYHKAECLDDMGETKSLAFWKSSDEAVVSSAFTATSAYTFDLSIPPLKKGDYEYELLMDNNPLLSGKIQAK